MKKMVKLLMVLVILISLVSCATITTPVAATSNELGRLVGHSTGTIWMGLFGNADASIKSACKNGGIREISTVDFEKKILFLGLGIRYTCTVTGE